MSQSPGIPPDAWDKRCAWPTPASSGLRGVHDPDPTALHLTFLTLASYQFTYTAKRGGMTEQLEISPGVELVGACFPGETDQETILLRDWHYFWRIPRSDVQVSPWKDSLVAAQRTIASARLGQAEQTMAHEDYSTSGRLYAQVSVELVAADASFRTIGQARMGRAVSLLLTKTDDAQIVTQLKQAASAYEWAFTISSMHVINQGIGAF